jgi:hypothetical protein
VIKKLKTASGQNASDCAAVQFTWCRSLSNSEQSWILACPFRKSYPDVSVVQSTEKGNGDNAADPLHGSP